MKVFALIVLLAVVAYASAADGPATDFPPAAAEHFLGLIQETEGGPTFSIGEYDVEAELDNTNVYAFGIPSCKFGPKWGNPVCLAKCISRGHAGGYCKGKVCTCIG